MDSFLTRLVTMRMSVRTILSPSAIGVRGWA